MNGKLDEKIGGAPNEVDGGESEYNQERRWLFRFHSAVKFSVQKAIKIIRNGFGPTGKIVQNQQAEIDGSLVAMWVREWQMTRQL